MTLRNRVTPTGDILADPARGLFMGNRGVLHDATRTLGPARWKHRNWVCCVLAFKGRRRPLMAPRRYTELFFLDEAVALAAGHRPCGECRRGDYMRFLDLWQTVTGERPKAPTLDKVLHAARAEPGARRLRRHVADMAALPDGAFVLIADVPHLVRGDALLPYAPGSYGAPVRRPTGPATLLTPPPTVDVMRAGFRPVLHPSADA